MSAAEQPDWLGSLDREVLQAAAIAQAGSDDLGDPRHVEPLQRFLDALASEAQLTPMGRAGASMDVVRLLTNRLRQQADLARFPEIHDEDVSDPLVILGLPRTGTTKLQRVIGTDAGFQALELWRALSPAPLPGSGEGPDPRIAAAEEQARLLLEMFPAFMAAHPMQAHAPEEEVLLLQQSFQARGNGLFYRMPQYVAWLDTQPADHPYEHLRDTLRYLQWQDGGRRGRPWLLKSPPHLGRLDQLFATFPGALAIHCHRDPAEAVPSLCRLVEQIRASRGITSVDREELGVELLAFCVDEWTRNLEVRDRRQDLRIVDVQYGRIVDDVRGVVEEIYAIGGWELPAASLAVMADWEAENPRDKFGRHEYGLAQFGLTRDQVHEAFRPYLDRFPDAVAQPA